MAEMIPDRLPDNASRGEKRVFARLQELPDDCIVYYEPRINDRHPDFVVIMPQTGVLIIEVKGWYLKNIQEADDRNVLYRSAPNSNPENQPHPLRQAREYVFGLIDKCKEHSALNALLHSTGQYQGKLKFPVGHMAVLSNITRDQLEDSNKTKWDQIFPNNSVATKDEVDEWEALDGEDLIEWLKDSFSPCWKISPFSEEDVNSLRAVIHPHISLDPLTKTPDRHSLRVLDLRQERNAQAIGDGHRLVYGVAGSGKTVLLIARAKILAQSDDTQNILCLCYNKSLATYLRSRLSSTNNVTAFHFDEWSKENGICRRERENDESLGERLLTHLNNGSGHSKKFDAILIDEAQDFDPGWFNCVIAAMKDPEGNLLIVSDRSQGLYRNRSFTWKDVGVQAQGRSISTKMDLDRNYRNTAEILSVAAPFAAESNGQDEGRMISVAVDPCCAERRGEKPVLKTCSSRREECETAIEIVHELLDSKHHGKGITAPLQPSDIGILYANSTTREKLLLGGLEKDLNSSGVGALWISSREQDNRNRVVEPGVKIQTIHSSKGLQYRAVILIWADKLPQDFDDTTPEIQRGLMYVALTRAEDYLTILASGDSEFLDSLNNETSLLEICNAENLELIDAG